MEIRPIMSALLRSKTGAVLVAAQVALTLAIVTNAASILVVRLATSARPSGVDEANVFQIAYVGSRVIDDREAAVQRDLEVLRAMPGVRAAALTNQFPLSQSGWQGGVTIDRKPASGIDVGVYLGDEAFIGALGLELVEGRDFTAADVVTADERVADFETSTVIVTRHLARKLFPTEATAVGKTIYFGSGDTAFAMQIVGVVDYLMTVNATTDDGAYDSILMPVRYYTNRVMYAVRTEPGQRSRVMRDAEQAMSSLRKDRVRTLNVSMDQIRDRRYRNDRTGIGMLVGIGVALLLVTGSGIVGVASLWVSQRRRQIGVRRALGAKRLDIIRYFVTENLIITTGGVAAGILLAIGLNQFLAGTFELRSLSPAYLAIGVVALWSLGIVAVLGPAWRAAAIPPAIATRGA
jgi:putative ABC transport system permease protein